MVSVPTLALNYTRFPVPNSPNLYQFGLSPLDEAHQMATHIAQTGYHKTLLLAPSMAWGQEVVKSYTDSAAASHTSALAIVYYSDASHLDAELRNAFYQRNGKHKAQKRDFDSVALIVPNPNLGTSIVNRIHTLGKANLPIIANSIIYRFDQPQANSALNGVEFCDIPYLLKPTGAPHNNPRLYALGLDAYLLMDQLSHGGSLAQNISGNTGILSENAEHRIQRQLTWAKIVNGLAKIDASPSLNPASH
jgi:hypothetical protein